MSRVEIEKVSDTLEGLEQRLDRIAASLKGAAGMRDLSLACAASAEKVKDARCLLNDTLEMEGER